MPRVYSIRIELLLMFEGDSIREDRVISTHRWNIIKIRPIIQVSSKKCIWNDCTKYSNIWI